MNSNEPALAPPAERWDAVVIGSGLGGLTAAVCLVAAGRKVPRDADDCDPFPASRGAKLRARRAHA